VKQNLNDNTIDIFVFPDTLINRSKVKYYKHIIEKVYSLLETDIPAFENEAEYKSLLENMTIVNN